MDKIGGINVLGETPQSSWFEEEIQALLGAIAYDPQRVPCNADMFAFGDSCTPKELAFLEVFAAEANTWKAYTSVLRELCDPALQVRHWSFLLKELDMSMQIASALRISSRWGCWTRSSSSTGSGTGPSRRQSSRRH